MSNQKKTTYTASDARKNLYSIIKDANQGLETYEIHLRGSDPVILMSKSEFESWQETLDILSSPGEIKAIREAMEEEELVDLDEVLKELELNETKI